MGSIMIIALQCVFVSFVQLKIYHTVLILQEVKKTYDGKKAKEGPNMIRKIADDEIAADIGNDVISLPSGWSIVPLTPPKVLHPSISFPSIFISLSFCPLTQLPRTIVEGYKKGKEIPSIQLELYWERDNQAPQKLSYKINFIGFTYQTFIMLTRDPIQMSETTMVRSTYFSLSPGSKIHVYSKLWGEREGGGAGESENEAKQA